MLRRRSLRVSFRLLLACALVGIDAAPPAFTEDAPPAAGHWEGSIDLAGSELSIDVDLTAGALGKLGGDISIPAQGAKDLPLASISSSGRDVSFEIQGVPGSPTFEGTLSEDGTKLAGSFRQSGQTFSFRLERKATPAAAAQGALAELDGFVSKAITDWRVPGLALVVVRDGEVVLSKGFGKRNLKDDLPVTGKTLFAIGSSTKAFTTFLLGTLVDEGKLDWDKPVREYLPEFKLEDASTSARITARDLCTHRSGLPRHDAVWYNATELSRKELVARLAYLAPNEDLRAKWQYNNLMFLTAGYLAERLVGESWEQAVRHRIFEPLGMTDSNFSVAESQKASDFALPYEDRDERVQEVPFRSVTNMGPAGSINSSAEDLAKWLLAHLGTGEVSGKRVLRKETLDELHAPQMAMGVPQERPEVSAPSYALGWMVESYRGHRRVEHGGNIDGFSALVCLLPDDGIGIAVLANLGGTPLPGILTNHVADRVLGLAAIDWNAEALGKRALARSAQRDAEKKKDVVRKPGTKPSHALADFSGDYENPGYGVTRIALVGDHLEWTYNAITSPLEHWHYDVFNVAKGAKDPVLEDTKLVFRGNVKGNIDSFTVALEPAVEEIVFKKHAEAKLLDPAYLEKLTGVYELSGQSITISLQGRTLTVSIPGQPLYELVPDQDDEFSIKGLSGFGVKFKPEQAEVEFRQPNGVFSAKRRGKS